MAVAGLTLGGLAGLVRQNLVVAAVAAGVGALVPFLYVSRSGRPGWRRCSASSPTRST